MKKKGKQLPPGTYEAKITDVKKVKGKNAIKVEVAVQEGSDRIAKLNQVAPSYANQGEVAQAALVGDNPDFTKLIERVVDTAMRRARTKRYVESSEDALVKSTAELLKAIDEMRADLRETRDLTWRLQEQVYQLKQNLTSAVTDAFRRGIDLVRSYHFE